MGKETAKVLIKQEHTIYTAAIRLDKMNDLVQLGGKPNQMDVFKTKDIENVIQTIIEKSKKKDLLWNNEGYVLYGSVEEISIEDAQISSGIGSLGN